MLSKSHLQVKVVKDSNATAEPKPDRNVADLLYIVHETGKAATKGAIALVTAYVVLDTARQVTVNASPKRH